MVDLGVLCGVILGYHYGVRPFAGIITERIGPLLESLRNAPHGVRYQVDALIQAYRMYQRRGSLVRTIAYYVPFLQPTPRITFGSLEDSNTHCTYIPRGFVSARKFIEEDTSETDESDYGESGLIHAFGPEEDLVSEEDARAESVSSSLWGSTDLTINFDLDIPRFHPKCSTPSLTQGSNESELHSNLESSTLNAATQAKVAALEHELSEMRIMIAKILATQTSLSVPSEVPATTEKPPVSLPPAPPPPPPPPPPPLPPAILVPSSKVINLRVGKPTEASLIKTVDKTPGNSQPATMSDVLKDLPSVRLRAVAK
ncbi:unnamed protein product [Allacma fusca]|uniref:Uncharacterized protein n=1 Tax=Allacma fusca TaxID=39272 RepID=A0A8J2Q5S5_9HEXA|nr:unnamed protein product [Allacma fusca]